MQCYEKRYNLEMTFAGVAQVNDVNAVSIKTLLLFISVFNAQSFSVVARREGVSASMVSRTIQQLEDALQRSRDELSRQGFDLAPWSMPE